MMRSGSRSGAASTGTIVPKPPGTSAWPGLVAAEDEASRPARSPGAPISTPSRWAASMIGQRIGFAPHRDIGGESSRRQRRDERRGTRGDRRGSLRAEGRIGRVTPAERLIPEFGFRRQCCRTDPDEREERGRWAGGGYDPGDLQSRWAPYTRAHGPAQGQLP